MFPRLKKFPFPEKEMPFKKIVGKLVFWTGFQETQIEKKNPKTHSSCSNQLLIQICPVYNKIKNAVFLLTYENVWKLKVVSSENEFMSKKSRIL